MLLSNFELFRGTMKLNYTVEGQGKPIILLHGLFGSLDNLGGIARAFTSNYQVIKIDLRNHGLSPWSNEMDYLLMASDVISVIEELSLKNITIIGHSMGGKVAMQLTELIPDDIDKIIVIDIAPVTYTVDSHVQVFTAIHTCLQQNVTDKKIVQNILSQYLDERTMQFLLKSFKFEHWLFNFKSIQQNYSTILGWQEIPPYFDGVLFIKGSDSDYINEDYQADILLQFPYAIIETVDGAGHNVHTEKTQEVVTLIEDFLI